MSSRTLRLLEEDARVLDECMKALDYLRGKGEVTSLNRQNVAERAYWYAANRYQKLATITRPLREYVERTEKER